jgi:EF-P beta-lysylation protein EpmB
MSTTLTLQAPIARASDGPAWQHALSNVICDPDELLSLLELDPSARPASLAAQAAFPLRVPRAFVARMQTGDWTDPLLRQVWPAPEEAQANSGWVGDPLKERRATLAPGLLQKYHGRALLLAAPHCAIHCRYCFRRHFNYDANTPNRESWLDSLERIRSDTCITEAILSGGDPLANSDSQLGWLVRQLEAVTQLNTLRIHSRLPVVIPARVTDALLALLRDSRLQVVVVLHVNHANELDADCDAAIAALRDAGATLLNQAVLLAGVNDSSAALVELSRRLFTAGVLPYYLHLPDRVAGTAHFDVSETRGRELVATVRAQLPGYLVPRLVREVPGRPAKTVVA